MKKLFLLPALLTGMIFQSCKKNDIENEPPVTKSCTVSDFGTTYVFLQPSYHIIYNDQGLIDDIKTVAEFQDGKHTSEQKFFYNNQKQMVKSEDNNETGQYVTTYLWEKDLLVKSTNPGYEMAFEYDPNKRLNILTISVGTDSYTFAYSYNTQGDLTEYSVEAKGSVVRKDFYRYSYPDKPVPSVQTLLKDKGLPFNISQRIPWLQNEPVKFEYISNDGISTALYTAVFGATTNGFISSVKWSGKDVESSNVSVMDVRKFDCK